MPNYTIGADAYEKVNDIVKPYGTNAVIIGGKTALEKAEDKIKAALTSAVQVTDTLWYGGNSTYENVDQLFATPSVQAADVLFAVGGGRVCDTVKVVGEKAGKPVFTFPTIGSNCSPVTAVCVIYKENGEMQGLFSLRNRRPMPLSTVRSSPKPPTSTYGQESAMPSPKRSNRHFQRGAIS